MANIPAETVTGAEAFRPCANCGEPYSKHGKGNLYCPGAEMGNVYRAQTPLASNLQFTREELEFIRNEFYASLSNGAEDPLFEKVYQKARALIAGSSVETKASLPGRAPCPFCNRPNAVKLQQQELYTHGGPANVAILTPAGFAALDRYHEMTDKIEELIARLAECEKALRWMAPEHVYFKRYSPEKTEKAQCLCDTFKVYGKHREGCPAESEEVPK